MEKQWHGEYDTDRVISEYFPPGFTGGFLDVGAADGLTLSNSIAFERMGWICLCIEANANFTEQLKKNRKHWMVRAVGSHDGSGTFHIFHPPGRPTWWLSHSSLAPRRMESPYQLIEKRPVNVTTVDKCIEEFGQFNTIDVLSVDTEGTELDVLRGFNWKKWKPRVVVVEDFERWKWNTERKAIKFMSSVGYKLDKAIKYNDFYVPHA